MLGYIQRKLGRTAAILMIGAAAGVIAAAVVVAQVTDSPDRRKPSMPVSQTAVAVSADISITASAARFSASGTVVEVAVDASKETSALVGVTINEDGYGPGLQAFAPNTISIKDGRGAGQLRLTPIPVDAPTADFVVRSIDLHFGAGNVVRRTGEWRLGLTLPADLAADMRSERLSPGSSTTVAAFTTSPLAAIRSTTETVVTVELRAPDGSPARQLGQPTMLVGRENLEGALVSRDSATGVSTFAFPPTPFGAAVTVSFGPLIAANGGSVKSSATLHLGAAMSRQSVNGDFGSSGSLGPADIVPLSGTAEVSRFDFVRSDANVKGSNVLALTVRGNYESTSDLVLITTGGRAITAEGYSSNYPRQQTGVLTDGTTTMWFRFGSLDELKGDLQLVIGAPNEVKHGTWDVAFTP